MKKSKRSTYFSSVKQYLEFSNSIYKQTTNCHFHDMTLSHFCFNHVVSQMHWLYLHIGHMKTGLFTPTNTVEFSCIYHFIFCSFAGRVLTFIAQIWIMMEVIYVGIYVLFPFFIQIFETYLQVCHLLVF